MLSPSEQGGVTLSIEHPIGNSIPVSLVRAEHRTSMTCHSVHHPQSSPINTRAEYHVLTSLGSRSSSLSDLYLGPLARSARRAAAREMEVVETNVGAWGLWSGGGFYGTVRMQDAKNVVDWVQRVDGAATLIMDTDALSGDGGGNGMAISLAISASDQNGVGGCSQIDIIAVTRCTGGGTKSAGAGCSSSSLSSSTSSSSSSSSSDDSSSSSSSPSSAG
ncbi:hypothetical protein Tco_0861898 [Tanacetum coccineum]